MLSSSFSRGSCRKTFLIDASLLVVSRLLGPKVAQGVAAHIESPWKPESAKLVRGPMYGLTRLLVNLLVTADVPGRAGVHEAAERPFPRTGCLRIPSNCEGPARLPPSVGFFARGRVTWTVGELVFIGLGLFDEKDITVKGLETAKAADAVFAEFYTSQPRGGTPEALERFLGRSIRVLGRPEVESGTEILEAATHGCAALLVPGDPMTATTHVALRLRAHDAGIPTRIVHGPSIVTAAAGALGLQSYKFGRSTTVPFHEAGFRPASPLDVILENRGRGLHTLILLDVREDGAVLSAGEALRYLLGLARERSEKGFDDATLACVLSDVGSSRPGMFAGLAKDLPERDLGSPPQCIIVPGELHFLEKEALVKFAEAPPDL